MKFNVEGFNSMALSLGCTEENLPLLKQALYDFALTWLTDAASNCTYSSARPYPLIG